MMSILFSPKSAPWRIVLVLCFFLILTLVVRQLNASKELVLSGRLSESLQVIDKCTSDPPEAPDNSTEVAGPGVPNIIHQIWRTSNVSTYSTELEASQDYWKNMFAPLDYTVKLWTDAEVHELIEAKYTWLLSTYEGYPQNIQRADLARLAIVHAEGGIYADLDVYPRNTTQTKCLQNLGLEAIFGPTATAGGLGLSNHFFMAERGSPLILWMLYEAKRRANSKSRHALLPYLRAFWTTGPMMVTAAFREYAWIYHPQRQNVGVLDQKYVKVLVGHAAGRSWHGSDGKALNYIADHVVKTVLMGAAVVATILGLVLLARRSCSLRALTRSWSR